QPVSLEIALGSGCANALRQQSAATINCPAAPADAPAQAAALSASPSRSQPLATLSHQQASMPSSAAVSAFALLVLAAICMGSAAPASTPTSWWTGTSGSAATISSGQCGSVCSRRGVALKRGQLNKLVTGLAKRSNRHRLPELQCLIKQGDVVYHCCCNWCKLSYLGAVLRLTQELNLNWRHPELASPTSPSLLSELSLQTSPERSEYTETSQSPAARTFY
uniref:IlGF domain-containing protein n=1 Tax=Macrostomum lignano TaxID=282301 RepID=A0A1I8FQU9_9PLAT